MVDLPEHEIRFVYMIKRGEINFVLLAGKYPKQN